MLLLGERCNDFVCFKLDLFGDLQTNTLVTRSRSGDTWSIERCGDRSLLILLPLQDLTTLIFFSGADSDLFLSGEDLSDTDSCLPSSLTIVGWY